jgi:two-component system, sensor histidine kinase and response regulator
LIDLAGVVAALRTAAAPAAGGGDPAAIAAIVARLGQLLADSDTAAMDVLSELEALIGQHRLAGRLRQVSERVERFDFDEALALLNGLDWAPTAA